MLKSWSIENFKPIVNSGELKLAPVTVLAGRNSSGKSSLLQSILMIAQTLSNQVPDRPLLPNERIVQLGTFEDILSEFSGSRTITVGFQLDFETEKPFVSRRISIEEGTVGRSVRISAIFSRGSDTSSSAIEASKVIVDRVVLEIIFEREVLFEKMESENGSYQREAVPVNLNVVVNRSGDIQLKRFLQNVTLDYLRLVPYSRRQPNYLGELRLQHEEIPELYLVTLSHFLPARLVRKFKVSEYREVHNQRKTVIENDKDAEGLEVVNNTHTEALSQVVEQITNFFTRKIRYLGPLRADPGVTQRNFAPTSELDDVGQKGEYAVIVYHYNQFAQVEWYNPQTMQVEQGTLQNALDIWVQHLGIATQVRTEIAGLSGITWKIILKEGQKARTLSEVGGGLNYVLPILVMGLLAPSNTLLIVEEPEVTLHNQKGVAGSEQAHH